MIGRDFASAVFASDAWTLVIVGFVLALFVVAIFEVVKFAIEYVRIVVL